MGVGTGRKVVSHENNPKLGVEQSGASLSGDYISLPEDATFEIYRLMSHNKMVGQALRYRRPTSRIITAVEALAGSFDEVLFYKPHIG